MKVVSEIIFLKKTAYRKSGTEALGWDPGPRTLEGNHGVGFWGWDHGVGRCDETMGWDPGVKHIYPMVIRY